MSEARNRFSFYLRIVLLACLLIGFGYELYSSLQWHGLQYSIDLVRSFQQGKLYMVDDSLSFDLVEFQGHKYLPFGIFPSLLIFPIVLIMPGISQGMILFFFHILNGFLIFDLARKKFQIQILDALILSLGFLLSTNYIFLIAYGDLAHYFSQGVAFSMVLLTVYFYFGRKNILLAALFFTGAFLTRFNLIFLFPFFAVDIFLSSGTSRERYRSLLVLLLPVLCGLLLNFWYNFARFGDWFETGYRLQLMTNETIKNNQLYGIFSPQYILTNIYFFLFQGPGITLIPSTKIAVSPYIVPDPWGMSILFTSPILLLGLGYLQRQYIRWFWLVISALILNLLVIFSYYGIGVLQYGYRYAIDLYPFFFILVLINIHKRIPPLWLVIIGLSLVFNIYMTNLVISQPV